MKLLALLSLVPFLALAVPPARTNTPYSQAVTVIRGTNIQPASAEVIIRSWMSTNAVIGTIPADISVSSLTFTNIGSTVWTRPGYTRWDNDAKAVLIDTESTGSSITIGEEINVRVRNTSGVNILDGQLVRLTTGAGPFVNVALADNSTMTNAQVFGMATTDIDHNGFGRVTTFGTVNRLNTVGYSEGAYLYLGKNGAYTNGMPAYPDYEVVIGVCEYTHGTEGKVFIRISCNGFARTGDLALETAARIIGDTKGSNYTDAVISPYAAIYQIATPRIFPPTPYGRISMFSNSMSAWDALSEGYGETLNWGSRELSGVWTMNRGEATSNRYALVVMGDIPGLTNGTINADTAVTVIGAQSNLIAGAVQATDATYTGTVAKAASALQAEADTLATVAGRGDFAGTETITPLVVDSMRLGTGAGTDSSGNGQLSVGYFAGTQSSGDSWSAFGYGSGSFSTGNEWSCIGFNAMLYAVNTNSYALGRYAGRTARGNNRLYLDVYATDPEYTAGGATNDMIYGDSGYLYLGRGAGAPGGAQGGTLRGNWEATLPGYVATNHTGNVSVSGTVTATAFSGSGRGITNTPLPFMPASELFFQTSGGAVARGAEGYYMTLTNGTSQLHFANPADYTQVTWRVVMRLPAVGTATNYTFSFRRKAHMSFDPVTVTNNFTVASSSIVTSTVVLANGPISTLGTAHGAFVVTRLQPEIAPHDNHDPTIVAVDWKGEK